MNNYEKPKYRGPSRNEHLVETLQIAIKNKMVKRESPEPRRVKTPPVVLDSDEILKIVPPFNPSSPRSLSAEKWIETIENIRMIYGWDSRLTLVYATLRLQDEAKRWFKDNLCDWSELKVKLVRQFSGESIDKSEYFEKLLRRRKEYSESFEKYVYDVERLAKKCDCNVETTINYIICGLRDSSLRSQLMACNCKSVDDLMSRIKVLTVVQSNYGDLRNQLDCSRSSEDLREPVPNERICYKCRKSGHYARNCTERSPVEEIRDQPQKRSRMEDAPYEWKSNKNVLCVKCKKTGHYFSDCKERVNKEPKIVCRNCNEVGHIAKECAFDVNIFCVYCKQKGHRLNVCPHRDLDKEERHNRKHSPEKTKVRREIYCGKCRKPGHYSKDCEKEIVERHEQALQKQSPQNTERRREIYCGKCKKPGHYSKDCSEENCSIVYCGKCGQPGHYSKDCSEDNIRKRSPESNELKRGILCSRCRKTGHSSKDCIADKLCYICKESGHIARNCVRASDEDKFRKKKREALHISGSELFCVKCKIRGHLKGDCRKMCFNCLQKGHLAVNCPSFNDHYSKSTDKASKDTEVICYNCKDVGHYAVICPLKNNTKRLNDNYGEGPAAKRACLSGKNEKLCYKCKKPGHMAYACQSQYIFPNSADDNHSDLKSEQEAIRISDLIKPVRIEDVYVTALVNLASDCTTLQKSEFEKHDWKMQPCAIEMKGFGPGSSKAIGMICKNVCIGGIDLPIDILIVEDVIQEFPLVLGCNFLDHPSVCVIKKYRSLEIRHANFESEGSPTSLVLKEGEAVEVKTENFDMEEQNLLELLDIIEKDYT